MGLKAILPEAPAGFRFWHDVIGLTVLIDPPHILAGWMVYRVPGGWRTWRIAGPVDLAVIHAIREAGTPAPPADPEPEHDPC